ncbi:MAG: hypothetical protein KDC44_20190, partial [Phaeodactylibacter sp.]|nr:hypothetical protein [Phaeodactylibacter sp.]
MKQPSTLFTVLLLFLLAASAGAQCPPLGFPEPTSDCTTAPILCENLDGYCATLGSDNVSQTFPGCPGFALNNDSWFAFYAGSTTITIEIVPSNCQSGPPNNGMQAAIYDGCNGPAMDTQCDCLTGPITLSSNSYVVGQIYWIVVDGCGGDICEYAVNVTQGSTVGIEPVDPGNIMGDQTACQGDLTSYNVAPVTGATQYNWTLSPPIGIINGNGSSSIGVDWIAGGPATLCLEVANQCFVNGDQVCYSINVAPSPTANAVPGLEVTCANPEIQLNGAGSSTGPGITYQWSGPGVVSGGNTLTPTVDQGGTYTLTVTNANTGCIGETMVAVAENTAPPVANAGPPLELNCVIPQLPLIGFGSSAGPPGFSYQWSTTDGNIVGSTTTLNTFVDAPGTYTITVTNLQNGCTAEASTVVTVNADTPVADPGPDVTIGCGASQVVLDGSNSTTGTNYDYIWMTNNGNIVSGGDTPTPTVDQSGTYTLVVVNGSNGCIDSSSVMVIIDNTPPTVAIANPGDISCLDPSLILDATGSSTGANFSYVWTTSDGNIV